MRQIERTNEFKRDFRKHGEVDSLFVEVLYKLANDEDLPAKYCNHSLTGNWKDHRDCHIKPDLVLIYCKPDAEKLQLVRLGSHSELDL